LADSIKNETHKERLGDIISVIHPLLNSLDLSLDYAKTSANKTNIKMSPLLLADICDSTIKTFVDFSQQQNTVLSISYESIDCFLPNLIDSTLITQSLNNVLNNAIKYTHSGMIIVECSSFYMDNKKMFCIEVTDTGIGIPADLLVMLTEPYTQAENDVPVGMPKGTGLGLFIVKKNLQLLGGHLVITSKPGVGSRLKLVFPRFPTYAQKRQLFTEEFQVVLKPSVEEGKTNEISKALSFLGITTVNQKTALSVVNTLYIQLSKDKNQWLFSYNNQQNAELPCTPLYVSSLYKTISKLSTTSVLSEPVTKRELPPALFTDIRLLLIEDEPLLCKVQEENFRIMGFLVDAVADAQSAYQHWLQYKHPIIVTDCRLDKSDGFELATRLNQLAQHQGVEPLIIIGQTASIKDSDHEQARASGMELLLQKPVTIPQWQDIFLTLLKDR
jgi:CheY-like chemotaxis protein/anti-sigma regulatory factor (Ser/Thr protein kinase)